MRWIYIISAAAGFLLFFSWLGAKFKPLAMVIYTVPHINFGITWAFILVAGFTLFGAHKLKLGK